MKILAVDDSPDILQILSLSLSKLGCRVDTVSSAKGAVNLLMENNYDLVITDAEMPEMSGIELCKFIKQHCTQIKILGISGTYALEEFKNAGADACLPKPFTLNDLKDIVRKLFATEENHWVQT